MALLKYTLLRVALFVPLVVIFLFLRLGILLSVVCATLIAFCIAFLFFRPQRNAASDDLRTAFSAKARAERARKHEENSSAEDEIIDANPEIGIDADQKPRTKTRTIE